MTAMNRKHIAVGLPVAAVVAAAVAVPTAMANASTPDATAPGAVSAQQTPTADCQALNAKFTTDSEALQQVWGKPGANQQVVAQDYAKVWNDIVQLFQTHCVSFGQPPSGGSSASAEPSEPAPSDSAEPSTPAEPSESGQASEPAAPSSSGMPGMGM